ncbi:MAG: hypothetical protein HUJ90_07750 [Bacteroidales bacterium]|nr:hypothetical protein [Bacteroidales bacterium]
MTKKELLYVMKNAVHHYVSPFPLEYEYSSAPWMFIHNLVPAQITDAYLSTCIRAENLNYRQLKKYIGTATIPPDWQFSNKGMILPLSFVNLERARAFWSSNVKKFLYDINQSGTDARKEIISMDILDLRTSGYRDTEVCALIDAYCKDVSKQSCHNLDLKERQEIERILKSRRIPQNQIRRCLWWGSKL